MSKLVTGRRGSSHVTFDELSQFTPHEGTPSYYTFRRVSISVFRVLSLAKITTAYRRLPWIYKSIPNRLTLREKLTKLKIVRNSTAIII